MALSQGQWGSLHELVRCCCGRPWNTSTIWEPHAYKKRNFTVQFPVTLRCKGKMPGFWGPANRDFTVFGNSDSYLDWCQRAFEAPKTCRVSYVFTFDNLSVCALYLVAQSCPTLCDPTDCSPPGSSVHGYSPGKNTGVCCHALLQGIFPTQGSNPSFLHRRWILYHLSHQGSPGGPTDIIFYQLVNSW